MKNRAKNCEFETLQDSITKDILIIGIKNQQLREKLSQNDDLKLDKAIELCLISESVKSQSKEMQNNSIGTSSYAVEAVGRNGNQVGAGEKQTRRGWSADNKSGGTGVAKSRFRQGGSNRDQSKTNVINNCSRCGRSHQIRVCPVWGKICNLCKCDNHFAAQCRVRKVNELNSLQMDSDKDENSDNFTIDSNEQTKLDKEIDWNVNLLIKDTIINFKLDSGANCNIISEKQFGKLCRKDGVKLGKTSDKLTSYTGNRLEVMGKCKLTIGFKDKYYKLDFHVIKGDCSAILGLNACVQFKLIKRINEINTNDAKVKALVMKFEDVFKGVGKISKPYHIELNEDVTPKIYPVRKVPFAVQDKFKKALFDLVKNGIIEKVEESSEWVHPLVIVKKSNGKLRICLDPKELNKAIKRQHRKLPTIDEIISHVNGAKYFSELDATSGFHQIPLDDTSSKLCTFGTPYGRFKFRRLPYGIRSASEVFQDRFEDIFSLEGVECYIDDLFVWGKTKEEHDRRLEKVLETARRNNIKFNKSKCKFGVSEIKYIGHRFSDKGITVDDDKVEAVMKMQVPKNKKDIQRFLGMVTYMGRFIENLSEKNQTPKGFDKKQ